MLSSRRLLSVAVFAAISSAAHADILYVDDDAPPDGDGLTWNTAYRFLQDALEDASVGTEIRVAEGIYRPDRSEAHPNGTGLHNNTFQLLNHVTIRGGYAGITGPEPDQRDWAANVSTLSGDLNGNDDGFFGNGENSYNVVKGSDVGPSGLLDGFTITGGNATGLNILDGGAGMHVRNGAPTIVDCIFVTNSAHADGGGMFLWASAPTLINCAFIGNRSRVSGTTGGGGGMYTSGGSQTLINCTFSGNVTVGTEHAGAIYSNGGELALVNSVVWNNGPTPVDDIFTTAYAVTNSCIEGGFAGTGNISVDPMFVDPDGKDDVTGTADDDLHLLPGSPCIDAGDNLAVPDGITADLAAQPRFADDTKTPDSGVGDPPIVDMGAYEYPGEVLVCPDFDGNEVVNVSDFLILIAQWGPCPPECIADVDGDGVINVVDFLILLANWGPCS